MTRNERKRATQRALRQRRLSWGHQEAPEGAGEATGAAPSKGGAIPWWHGCEVGKVAAGERLIERDETGRRRGPVEITEQDREAWRAHVAQCGDTEPERGGW